MASGHRSLLMLPVFAFGVLVLRFQADLTRLPSLPVLSAGLLLAILPWSFPLLGIEGLAAALVKVIAPVIGATLIVMGCRGSRWLTGRRVQWLGSRSFSLYLVHEPIVVTLGFLLPTLPGPVLVLIAVPLSLLVAEVFWRLVERPSLRLARRIGGGSAPGTTGTQVRTGP